MTDPSSTPTSRGFVAGLKVFLTALLRLLIILAVAALIGGGIYLGFRYVYPRYLQPVAQHTTQIEDLESRLSEQETQSAERLGTLEGQHAADATQLAGLEKRLSAAEGTLTEQQKLLAQLDTLQSKVNTLNETMEKSQALTAEEISTLSRQAKLMQVMQYFTRGRLYLLENNLGLARSDIQSARDQLAELKSSLPDTQQPTAAFAVQQLDLALGNLPAYPVMAAGQLEVVWDLLLMDLPADAAPASFTSGLCPSGDCTMTPTPMLSSTPTPSTSTTTHTPSATATPILRASSTPTPRP